MKKCTMLMALAAMMIAAPMIVSAQKCGATDDKKTCSAAKAKCTKEECKDGCKCPKKAACAKEGCEDGCKCPKKKAKK